jgi:hypothetical protein
VKSPRICWRFSLFGRAARSCCRKSGTSRGGRSNAAAGARRFSGSAASAPARFAENGPIIDRNTDCTGVRIRPRSRTREASMRVSVIGLLLTLAVPVLHAGAERTSPPLVRDLVAAMDTRGIDAIAAPDPSDPGRFVAALVFPDVQLLLVSSRHESAAALAGQIAKRQFRDVYVALQTGIADGRIFIHDMGCDGVRDDAEDIDVFYEGAGRRTVFDGRWEAQELTEAAYLQKHQNADEHYARALTLLLEAVRRLPA